MANYFDEEVVRPWLLEYQSLPKDSPDSARLRGKLMCEIGKIVKAIIHTHHFTMYEPYDDLYQEAIVACLKALDKFDPNYITDKGVHSSVFNYFSLTAKKTLIFYTLRQAKHRGHADVDAMYDIPEQSTADVSALCDTLVQNIRRIMTEQKPSYLPLVDLLEEHLYAVGTFNRRKFYALGRERGYKTHKLRTFFLIIKDNKEYL